jgi:glyoxylase-like metal-dependent hydrolase (beta-lactamase superfamily II)
MAKKSIAVLTVCVAALSWAAGAPQDAKTVIANASKALGADNLKTIEYSGAGYDYAIGQNANPGMPWPKFNDKTYTRTISFDPLASRMQRVRTQGENPPRGGGLQPIFGEQQQNQVVVAGSPQTADLADELMMMLPYGFLRSAAAASDATVKARKAGGKAYTVISFTGSNKAAVNGYLDSDNVLEKVETKIDNPVMGDIPFETAFTDYKDFGQVKFPTHIVQKQGGYPVFELTVTDVKPNLAVNITAPPAGPPAAGPPTTSDKLGDGIYLLPGASAAMAIDFKDYIVVLEGPQNDQRAEAIIAESKRLIPNKPIRYVVNTHAHFDHSGGLRAFVAEGATIVTHEINKPYYEKLYKNPHTLNPDTLALNPKKPTFMTMKEKLVLTDGNHVIELYHLQNYAHNDGMIMAYFPKEKFLYEADAFTPPPRRATQTPANISPYTVCIADNIARLKLDVQRIISVHYPADDRNVGMGELLLAVGRT